MLLANDRLGDSRIRRLLEGTREIDICARLADYFGPSAHLAAQGTSDIDLLVYGPTIKAEVKYLIRHINPWGDVLKDWNWLLGATNAGGEFGRWAWLVFWPSVALYKLTACQTVSRDQDQRYSLGGFAPFVTYTEPRLPPNGVNQQLFFKTTPPRLSFVSFKGGKTVRVELVGDPKHPLWCALYTRCLSADVPSGAHITRIDDLAIDLR